MACVDELKQFVDHLEKPGPNYIGFVLVTGSLVGWSHYCEGELRAWDPPVASGSGFRYSSNERWNFPDDPDQQFVKEKIFPFDPNRRDPITLTVNLHTGQVAGSFSFQAQCEHGILYGFNHPSGLLKFPTMHVLMLMRKTDVIPT